MGKMGGVGGGARGPVSEAREVADEGRQDLVDVREGSWCWPAGY